MKILVTGHAGFIGFHVVQKLLNRGDEVVGFDAVNDYYDRLIKEARLKLLQKTANESQIGYISIERDLADQDALAGCFNEHKFERVIHLAAQAGVRYSLEDPHSYIHNNIIAFTIIQEELKKL